MFFVKAMVNGISLVLEEGAFARRTWRTLGANVCVSIMPSKLHCALRKFYVIECKITPDQITSDKSRVQTLEIRLRSVHSMHSIELQTELAICLVSGHHATNVTLGARDSSSAVSGFCEFGLRPKMCRPSANTENFRCTREKPLIPRVHQRNRHQEIYILILIERTSLLLKRIISLHNEI